MAKITPPDWIAMVQRLKKAGVNQSAVAERCGISKSSISELVNGVAKRDPTYSVGKALVDLYDETFPPRPKRAKAKA